MDQIQDQCGPEGVQAYELELIDGLPTHDRVTDDTQMTLFTVEGIFRASVRTDRGLGFTVGVVHHAYDRWLDTQLLPAPSGERDRLAAGRAVAVRAPRARHNLHHCAHRGARRRGNTFRSSATRPSTVEGLRRCDAQCALGLRPPWSNLSPRWRFDSAASAAGYTHGHPTGQLAAGALAVIIGSLVRGANLDSAVDAALQELALHDDHVETTRAMIAARQKDASGTANFTTVDSLGRGWVAEEA